jgi:nicotinate-nucleotide--dimethylbenzimidazole phosphoribosyltransferase
LESLGERLAAISGRCPPPVAVRPVVAVFAGDHGVLSEGVTPWPQAVTAQMVANFLAGGAAINVIAREVGARVVVVDVGVATPIPGLDGDADGGAGTAATAAGFRSAKVRPGTSNLAVEPAMSTAEADSALDVGALTAAQLLAEGADCLITGDMGIGNTTPSAALIAAITGRSVTEVTGRGTGISDEALGFKVSAISRGLERAAGVLGLSGTDLATASGRDLVAQVGGLEIAALAGFVIGGAAARVPVIVDGVIALAGALVASRIAPASVDYLIAGHRSTEPGASAALSFLGLEPVLDLGLRLGEGTGACLSLPCVRAAARILSSMATFGDAGVAALDG